MRENIFLYDYNELANIDYEYTLEKIYDIHRMTVNYIIHVNSLKIGDKSIFWSDLSEKDTKNIEQVIFNLNNKNMIPNRRF